MATVYSKRVSQRLNALLNSRFLFPDLAGRVSYLAKILSLPSNTCSAYVLGEELPSYEVLFFLSEHFNVEPGFFLDKYLPEIPLSRRTLATSHIEQQALEIAMPPDGRDEPASHNAMWSEGVEGLAPFILSSDIIVMGDPCVLPFAKDKLYCVVHIDEYQPAITRCKRITPSTALLHNLAHPSEGSGSITSEWIVPVNASGVLDAKAMQASGTSIDSIRPLEFVLRPCKRKTWSGIMAAIEGRP